jgi:hypothetical protein
VQYIELYVTRRDEKRSCSRSRPQLYLKRDTQRMVDSSFFLIQVGQTLGFVLSWGLFSGVGYLLDLSKTTRDHDIDSHGVGTIAASHSMYMYRNADGTLACDPHVRFLMCVCDSDDSRSDRMQASRGCVCVSPMNA